MERLQYFIRRLLLVIPTFLGITIVVFTICQFVPGGPVEQAIARMKGGMGHGGASTSAMITAEQKEAIKKQYGFDLPIHERYYKWLITDRMGMMADSWKYSHKTVWEVIRERFPVSLTFGITGMLAAYLICIPLGIAKALKNGSNFDVASSVVVFVLYAIPAFAFGMLLKMFFSGTVDGFWDIFPLGGFRSDNWAQLGFWDKIKDQFHHMVLPVTCYVIGSFAMMTMLMKNSLLDQIGQDYVRTVLAKGGTMERAVWRHALRNALIPIATGIGEILTIMFAGSVLIERVFAIDGIGLLSLDAAITRDYMVFTGILALQSILYLIGRIISDFTYVLIDPRINFAGEK